MHVAILALLLAPLVAAPGCQREFDERVAAGPGGQLEVDLDFGEGLRPDPGSLEIASSAADEVRVTADATGWGASGVRLRVSGDGQTVRVDGGVAGAFSWLFGGPHVRVRVWVPRDFSVDARCSTGPVRVEDLHGNVRVRTEDGELEVSTVEGSVRLRSGSSDVRVSEVVGDVDVRVGEGEVEMSWVRGDAEVRSGWGALEFEHVDGSLSARTDRGHIELRDMGGTVEAKTERGSVFASFAGRPQGLLETRRGSVEVRIPADAGALLDASSARGSVELDRSFGVPDDGEDHIVTPLNGGGAPLRLYTARGSVVVRPR